MKHVVAWLLMWVPLFWLWQLLAGEWNHIEWIAGACAATIAASLGELARTRAGAGGAVPLRVLASAWSVPALVVADFGLLVWALGASVVRREIVRGEFVRRELPPAPEAARAWLAVAATYSPNAYVAELDEQQERALLHELVPWRRSEEPL